MLTELPIQIAVAAPGVGVGSGLTVTLVEPAAEVQPDTVTVTL